MGKEPVEALGPPLEREVVKLDEIRGRGRGGEVEEAAAAFGNEIGAGGVGQDQDGAELRLDPARRTVDDDALPLLELEPIVVGGLRGRLGIADHPQAKRKGRCRGRIGCGAECLGVGPDGEHARRRYPQPRHHPGIVEPRRHVGGDTHEESILLRLSLGREHWRGGQAGMGKEEPRGNRLAPRVPAVEGLTGHLHLDGCRPPFPRLLGAGRHECEEARQRQADRLSAEIGHGDRRHQQGERPDAAPAGGEATQRI